MSKKVKVTFEDQVVAEYQAMIANGTFPKRDIQELKVMDPPTLWDAFYRQVLKCDDEGKKLPELTVEFANQCWDKLKEYEAYIKDMVVGEDVVLPPKKTDQGGKPHDGPAKKAAAKKTEPVKEVEAENEEVILPPKKVKEPVKAVEEKKPAPPKKVEEKKPAPPKKKEKTKKGEIQAAIKKFEKPQKKEEVVPPTKSAPKKAAKPKTAAKQVEPKKMKEKKPRKASPRPRDRFGFKEGTTVSDAANLMDGTLTLSEIAREMNLEQNLYYVVNRLRDKGHRVTFHESKVTAIAAKKKKVA